MTKDSGSNNFRKPSQVLLIGLLIITVLALFSTAVQNNDYKTKLNILNQQNFRNQLNEGKACGLVTLKDAEELLSQDIIIRSGNIISANSIAASSRPGSPRADGCYYEAPQSNSSYIDVIIKTYDSNNDAKKYYYQQTDKVLFIADKTVDNSKNIELLRYSSGVHYSLIGNSTLEVSASKMGSATGKNLEDFSKQVFDFVAVKL